MSLTHANKPNFFILGAAKSGTTSLYFLLKQHPDIFLTEEKEPTFFNDGFQVIDNPIDYFELYDPSADEPIRGEASHTYMSNPRSGKVLKALFPDAKFVVILRNPAARAHSLYHHMRRNGYEYINSFEKAITAEDKRFASDKFKRTCTHSFYNFLYFRSGLYGQQLQHYFSIFDRSQFHVIKFEEFVADQIGHVRGILEFLGVDPDFSPEPEISNAGKVTARFPGIQYCIRRKLALPRPVRKLLMSALKRVNKTPIPPLNGETKTMLMEKYAEDLKLLNDLTGISFPD